MFARTKVAVIQSIASAIALAVFLSVVAVAATRVVRERDTALYREKLSSVLNRLEVEQAGLQKGGLADVQAYVDNAQKAVLDELAAQKHDGGALVILDGDGKVLLAPKEGGLGDLSSAAWVKGAAAGEPSGAADGDLGDERYWMPYARFPAWKWTVAYLVPEAVRSAAVNALVQTLLALSVVVLLAQLAITALGHRRIGRDVTKVVREAARLREAVDAGHLSERGDGSTIDTEFRPIVEGMNATMDAYARPIAVTGEYVTAIARGEVPPVITDAYQGDFARTKDSLNELIEMVTRRAADIDALIAAALEGRLDYRADASRYEGGNARVIEGMNRMLDALVTPLKVSAASVEQIARGEIPEKITAEYRGDFDVLKRNLNGCIDAVNALIRDANALAEAAVEGKLSTRADASRHQGDFRKIVAGVNATLDAVIRPTEAAARCVEAIARGEIPARITETWPGEFARLRDNLNTCIAAVNALVADANGLAQAAVEGKLQHRAEAGRHQGDFRRIVEGVNRTLDALLAPVDEATRALERLSQRDLRARVSGSFQGDHTRLKDTVNATAEALGEALSQVSDAVDQVSSAASQIASSSQAVASGASEQAASLAETTSTIETVSGMTRQAADNAQQANALAVAARTAATAGAGAVEQLQGAMGRIRQSSEGTSQIIKDVSDIAFQTNLLALNAAVEAARAGEAGRGFAVVAEEVRSLALRAKEAATKTEELIRQSVREAGEGETAAKAVATKLEEIVGGVGKVTDIVSEIAAAAKEQANGIAQVNTAISEMDRVTQQNAASAEESSSAASELSNQAETLASMIGQFQLGGPQQAQAPRRPVRGLPGRTNGVA